MVQISPNSDVSSAERGAPSLASPAADTGVSGASGLHELLLHEHNGAVLPARGQRQGTLRYHVWNGFQLLRCCHVLNLAVVREIRKYVMIFACTDTLF